MAAGDLVTLSQVQTAYPGLTAAQLADAPQVISAISSEVALRYPRVAPRATYAETHDPGNTRTIELKHRPVIQINRVRADMAKVLAVNYTGAGRRATAAVVATGEAALLTPVNLTLAVDTQTPTVLDFATYPTVQALADHVNTLSGWSASVAPNQGNMPGTDLEPAQGPKSAVGTGAGVWGYVRDLNDFDLVDAARGELLLYEWRGTSFSSPGRLWGTDPRATTVRVSYDAGMVAATADVVRAVIVAVGACLESTNNPGVVVMKRFEDYEYRLADPTYRFPAESERILNRYRDRRFF